jgi:lysyl-tRNA synthetase class I
MTDALDTNIDASYILPSNPEDRKKIKSQLQEIAAALHWIDDKKSYIKDVTDDLHAKFKIPKKMSSKLAKTLHKHDYDKQAEESDLFKLFYEEVIDKVTVPPATSNFDTE